jgi:DNA-binding Xre family transcriptional regulator
MDTIQYKLAFQKRAIAKGVPNAWALSQILGASPNIKKLWEGKATQIKLDTVSKLCAILEITPGKLFIPEDEEEPELSKVKNKITEIAPIGDYPKYQIWIQPLGKVRGFHHGYDLWKKIGGSKETTQRMWTGEIEIMPLFKLSLLCEVLRCSPDKLFALTEEVEAQRQEE